MGEVGRLMLFRFGESILNAQDSFTGSVDVPLTSPADVVARVSILWRSCVGVQRTGTRHSPAGRHVTINVNRGRQP